jgi:hypothetical protein
MYFRKMAATLYRQYMVHVWDEAYFFAFKDLSVPVKITGTSFFKNFLVLILCYMLNRRRYTDLW